MRVFISAPLSIGDQFANVRAAIEAADAVLRGGHTVYLPHLTAFWHLVHPHSRAEWLDLDKRWLEVCDAVLRLPGQSKGADIETAFARALGIPVVTSVEELASITPRRHYVVDSGHIKPMRLDWDDHTERRGSPHHAILDTTNMGPDLGDGV